MENILHLENKVNFGKFVVPYRYLLGSHFLVPHVNYRLAVVVQDNVQAIKSCVELILADHCFTLLKGPLTESQSKLLLSKGYSILNNDKLIINTSNQSYNPCIIGVFTSGTTGEPKIINHTLDSLNTYRNVSCSPAKWFVPYSIGTYAWYQMLFLGLFVPNQDLCFGSDIKNLTLSFIDYALSQEVDSISSTPTFWRKLLLENELKTFKTINLKNITLGGEIVDQNLLDVLSNLYPKANIKHIYASTEAGVAIVVDDKKAGFPISKLDATHPKLTIKNNKLFVSSRFSTKSLPPINTGDLVEIKGDRVYFIGRENNDFINVGGNKANKIEIENVILEHPSILWCSVYSQKTPITNIVGCNLVLRPDSEIIDRQIFENGLFYHCKNYLPDYSIPRVWNVLNEIPTNENQKSIK